MNRYYTLMLIPEKSDKVRRIQIPTWTLRAFSVSLVFVSVFLAMMVLDYYYVMNQIAENRSLKIDNRRLKQQIQVFENKVSSLESTIDRVKSFTNRLKIITNIEDRDSLVQNLQKQLPDAANVSHLNQENDKDQVHRGSSIAASTSEQAKPNLSHDIAADHAETPDAQDNEAIYSRFASLQRQAIEVELILQDEYELLADQKEFLAAMPTRRPAVGYVTSGFGIRKSPYGTNDKMHEGIDIANHPGTPIKATAEGTVTWAENRAGYGQLVVVDHGYGLETWYGHLRKILVQKGEKVKKGQSIALLGNSGRSTGPHVHYEVRVHGYPIDPAFYFLEN